MKQFAIHKNEQEGWLYEYGEFKRIVSSSKLKNEHDWPLLCIELKLEITIPSNN